jgi:RimJ/RimL family protein N-acetyltransferase
VPTDEASTRAYVEAALADAEAHRAVPFAVRRRRSDAIVGSIRFMSFEWWSWPRGPIAVPGEPRRAADGDPPDVVEIGHAWLARDAQHTEVFPAACALMMRHAFEGWRVHRLVLKTDARNERSRAAILRLGATFEGVLRKHLPAADGIVRDTAMFSVIQAEWPIVATGLASRLAAERSAS